MRINNNEDKKSNKIKTFEMHEKDFYTEWRGVKEAKMTLWLCDECGAKAVLNGECKPLGAYYKANEVPFANKENGCDRCHNNKKYDSLMKYPIEKDKTVTPEFKNRMQLLELKESNHRLKVKILAADDYLNKIGYIDGYTYDSDLCSTYAIVIVEDKLLEYSLSHLKVLNDNGK